MNSHIDLLKTKYKNILHSLNISDEIIDWLYKLEDKFVDHRIKGEYILCCECYPRDGYDLIYDAVNEIGHFVMTGNIWNKVLQKVKFKFNLVDMDCIDLVDVALAIKEALENKPYEINDNIRKLSIENCSPITKYTWNQLLKIKPVDYYPGCFINYFIYSSNKKKLEEMKIGFIQKLKIYYIFNSTTFLKINLKLNNYKFFKVNRYVEYLAKAGDICMLGGIGPIHVLVTNVENNKIVSAEFKDSIPFLVNNKGFEQYFFWHPDVKFIGYWRKINNVQNNLIKPHHDSTHLYRLSIKTIGRHWLIIVSGIIKSIFSKAENWIHIIQHFIKKYS